MSNLFFLYMTLKWCPLHCSTAVPNQFGEEGHNCMIIWCCKSFSFNKDKILGLLGTVSYIKLVRHLNMNTSPNEVYWKFIMEKIITTKLICSVSWVRMHKLGRSQESKVICPITSCTSALQIEELASGLYTSACVLRKSAFIRKVLLFYFIIVETHSSWNPT